MDRANVFRTMGATSFVGNREENDFFIPVTKEQKNIFKEQNKDWRDTHPYFSDGDKLTKLLYVRLFIRKKGT